MMRMMRMMMMMMMIMDRLIGEREHVMRIPVCSRSGDILEPSLLSQVGSHALLSFSS